MNAKDILIRVAEGLPDDASPLDAINRIELAFAAHDALEKMLPAERGEYAPAWLYDSASRLSTIAQQTQKRGPTAISHLYTAPKSEIFPMET